MTQQLAVESKILNTKCCLNFQEIFEAQQSVASSPQLHDLLTLVVGHSYHICYREPSFPRRTSHAASNQLYVVNDKQLDIVPTIIFRNLKQQYAYNEQKYTVMFIHSSLVQK